MPISTTPVRREPTGANVWYLSKVDSPAGVVESYRTSGADGHEPAARGCECRGARADKLPAFIPSPSPVMNFCIITIEIAVEVRQQRKLDFLGV
jgi:hypothetical protein